MIAWDFRDTWRSSATNYSNGIKWKYQNSYIVSPFQYWEMNLQRRGLDPFYGERKVEQKFDTNGIDEMLSEFKVNED